MTLQIEEGLTADDVLLKPGFGVLNTRNIPLKAFIYPAPMDTVAGYRLVEAMLEAGEYAIIPRWHEGCTTISEDEYLAMIKAFLLHPNCFLAVGASIEELHNFDKLMDRLEIEITEQCINICIDTAHGYSVYGLAAIQAWRSINFVRYIMTGSIATDDAVGPLVNAGATHLRVGIGPGGACTTRLMTGCGVPQLTAVANVAHRVKVMKDFRSRYGEAPPTIHVIADGGIKQPGDAAKYLAAGADSIMMGSVFSKTAESPGWENSPLTGSTKRYRGQASAEYQMEHYGKASNCPEGAVSEPFSWKGDTVESVLGLYRDAVRHAISYCGLEDMEQLNPQHVTFIKISAAGYKEGTPHAT